MVFIKLKTKTTTAKTIKPLAEDKCKSSFKTYSKKEAIKTPKKLKKLAEAIICPLLLGGLFICKKVSKGIKKRPPEIPKNMKISITKNIFVGKKPKRNNKKEVIKPAKQDIPSSIFPFPIFPAKRDPIAIPIAVDKKRYPPPTSVSFKDSIANGMVFNWT